MKNNSTTIRAIVFYLLLTSYLITIAQDSNTTKNPSQENETDVTNVDKILIYDFSTRKIDNNTEFVEAGKKIQIKVKNINTLLYDITFGKEVVKVAQEPPAILSSTFPLFPSASEESGLALEVLEKLTIYQAQYKRVLDNNNKLNELNTLLHSWEIDAAVIDTIIKKKAEVVSLEVLKNLHNLDEHYFAFLVEADPKSTITKEVVRQKTELDKLNLRKVYTDFNILISNIDTKTFEYASPTFKASGDLVRAIIDISPKEGKKALPLRSEKNEIDIKVWQRHKFSFSTGLFVSDLNDNKYVTSPNYNTNEDELDTITSYSIREESTRGFSFGTAGFLHWTYQQKEKVGVGLNVGAGIDLEENVHFLSGLTVAFGHKRRILLNGGLAWAKVEELSNAITFDRNQEFAEEPKIKTNSKLRRVAWFGISYNLFN